MAACEIQVPIRNTSVLHNIESFMKDTSYREAIENSANYNSRLKVERKLRIPFLDAQTGVVQTPSNLFMHARQRMPGVRDGQVYTYPAKRWRKKRRQYLLTFMQPKRCKESVSGGGGNPDDGGVDGLAAVAVDNPLILNEDSKDSVGGSSSKDETLSKEASWYYDELEMQEIEGFDEPEPDSDYDYEDTYAKKRRRRSGKGSRGASDSPMRRGAKGSDKGFGRGRRRGINYTIDYSDADKPYLCGLCGARYKTRPGLTYHYTHSHKEKTADDEGNSLDGAPSSPSNAPPKEKTTTTLTPPIPAKDAFPQPDPSQGPPAPWGKFQDSYLTFLNTGQGPPGTQNSPKKGQSSSRCNTQPQVVLPTMPSIQTQPTAPSATSSTGTNTSTPAVSIDDESSSESSDRKDMSKESSPASIQKGGDDKDKANPSPYCDFCLGNEEANKKSGRPEELVSCSDCGRSGHPTCLQFTANMIISVRKYRWQCIECKCCSVCGTSDNDDQLLFCDDCDRGYHMYCLSPPLSAPPEGSWSCKLCIEEFHSK